MEHFKVLFTRSTSALGESLLSPLWDTTGLECMHVENDLGEKEEWRFQLLGIARIPEKKNTFVLTGKVITPKEREGTFRAEMYIDRYSRTGELSLDTSSASFMPEALSH